MDLVNWINHIIERGKNGFLPHYSYGERAKPISKEQYEVLRGMGIWESYLSDTISLPAKNGDSNGVFIFRPTDFSRVELLIEGTPARTGIEGLLEPLGSIFCVGKLDDLPYLLIPGQRTGFSSHPNAHPISIDVLTRGYFIWGKKIPAIEQYSPTYVCNELGNKAQIRFCARTGKREVGTACFRVYPLQGRALEKILRGGQAF